MKCAGASVTWLRLGRLRPRAPGSAEELVTQGRLQGLNKADATLRVQALLPTLDLDGLGPRALNELSGGQRRRFDIAIGLVHTPQLVFLDEPTTGLDPQSRANLWQHIRSLRDDHGVTVVITTHYLEEADALADRIMVMDHGVVVANDTPEQLKAQVSGDVITVSVDSDVARAEIVAHAAIEIANVSDRSGQPAPDGRSWRCRCRAAASRARVSGAVVAVGQCGPADPRRRLPHPDRTVPSRGRRGLTVRSASSSTDPTCPTRSTCTSFARAPLGAKRTTSHPGSGARKDDTCSPKCGSSSNGKCGILLRNPVWVFFGLTQPILYLVLFGPLLKNVSGGGLGGSASWSIFVPGLLLQLAIFGAGFAGFGIIQELREGVVDRQRVTPARRVSLLLGRTLSNVLTIGVQAAILVLVAIPFGLEPSWIGIAVSIALVCLLALGISAASYSMGLILKNEDSFAPFIQGVSLPLLLLSGVLLPMTLAPLWLKKVSDLNPLSYLITAVRSLFVNDYGTDVAIGIVVTVCVAVLLAIWGTRTFQRTTS